MRSKRIRYLIAFVAAMFLANNVAAAARACIAALSGPAQMAAQALDTTGVEHLKSAAGDETLCLAHCAQSRQNHEQEFVTNVSGVVFIPVLFVRCPSVEIKPTASVIAWAPQAVGPPLTILFRNLRN